MKTKAFVTFLFGFLCIIFGAVWYYRQPNCRELSNGYIITHYVGHLSEFDAQYIIITKLNSNITVEIIRGPGPQAVEKLEGEAAILYLNKMGLNK